VELKHFFGHFMLFEDYLTSTLHNNKPSEDEPKLRITQKWQDIKRSFRVLGVIFIVTAKSNFERKNFEDHDMTSSVESCLSKSL